MACRTTSGLMATVVLPWPMFALQQSIVLNPGGGLFCHDYAITWDLQFLRVLTPVVWVTGLMFVTCLSLSHHYIDLCTRRMPLICIGSQWHQEHSTALITAQNTSQALQARHVQLWLRVCCRSADSLPMHAHSIVAGAIHTGVRACRLCCAHGTPLARSLVLMEAGLQGSCYAIHWKL